MTLCKACQRPCPTFFSRLDGRVRGVYGATMPYSSDARLVTLIGGSGFIGRAATEELTRLGWRVRVLVRNVHAANRLKPLGNLGQIAISGGDVRSPESVAAALDGADAVVNFVGILAPGGGATFDAVHHRAAALVAQQAARAGVRRLVHVSAIGADRNSPSDYGRSKGEGEQAVRAAFPSAAIVRPSIVFGADDQFTNRFATVARQVPFMVPVIAPDTRFQPVFVDDVARAITRLVTEQADVPPVTELGGPQVFTMRQINEYIVRTIGLTKPIVDVPDYAARMIAKAGFLPGAPLTWDQYLMLQRDNVADTALPGFAALGIVPTPMGAVAPQWLARYRRGGRFAAQVQNPQP